MISIDGGMSGKAIVWTGRVISILVSLVFVMSSLSEERLKPLIPLRAL